jgi:putative ABC transport system permease protein
VLIGLGASLLLTRLMANLLFGVGPTDLATFAAVPFLVLVTGLVSCYIPARRATRMSPIDSLRSH